LIHFLLLGAALFATRSLLADRDEAADRFRIEIGAGRVEELANGFRQRAGRAPDRRELDGLIEAEAEEEMLFREAVARGLMERDGGVQTRLVQKMLFLEGGGELADAPMLLARAVELGLHEDDVVVRRILVQKMRLIGSSLREDQQVSPAEIEAAYRTRREALRSPDRLDLVHVFLSRDDHGEAVGEAAVAVLERLRSEDPPLADAPDLGQPFPLGHVLERRSREELDRRFGPGFGEAVFVLPEGGWSAPIASAYGLHLVRVTRREAGEPPPLERVADRLRLELEADRRLENLDALLGSLRTRYHVRVHATEPLAPRDRLGPIGADTTRDQETG
jgi:hypothetical protein